LCEGRWRLVLFWAKEMPKAAMFNAGIEGIDTAAAFRDVFKSKRCLIPADGFYEWTISLAGGKKDPWHIYLPDYAPFSFVGLWAYNTNLDVASCTIIPSRPASRMKNPRPAAGNPRPGLLRRMARPGDAEGISERYPQPRHRRPVAVQPSWARRQFDRHKQAAE